MSFLILNADARQIPMKDKSVQCVVTSPPYWGLRDYGTATWVGGDEGCDHKIPAYLLGGGTNKDHAGSFTANYTSKCKCGATRIDSQIGLEPTPEAYVAKIVAVFAEVKRVLRDDGTVWCNLGDSYGHGTDSNRRSSTNGAVGGWQSEANEIRRNGLKPKDLVGVPWRVAFALQAAGWYLRSAITWCKLNPMPESVTDRPTKATEQIFLLTKSERYYYDADSVREPSQGASTVRSPAGWKTGNGSHGSIHENGRELKVTYNEIESAGRNMRDYWLLATQPYPEAHFATFPEEIALRCIKAGTSEKGACAECGAPWARVTENPINGPKREHNKWNGLRSGNESAGQAWQEWRNQNQPETIGWKRTCKHEDEDYGWYGGLKKYETRPCIVLDPFSGAGTVPLVADKLGRRGIGLELKLSYCEMATRRCYDDAPLLAEAQKKGL
jgi:DNA modification methylase